MTLIVGMKCCDGVVIAADTAAAVESGERGTSTVHNMHKICACQSPCHAVGVAGTAGLSQIYGLALRTALSDITTFSALDATQAMIDIRDHFCSVVHEELRLERKRAKLQRKRPKYRDSAGHALVAVWVSGEARLFHYSDQVQAYEVRHESPYQIIGDGQDAANPFLQYLRLKFLDEKSPNLAEGVVAALWTVRYAINVHHQTVGGDVQVVTLSDSRELKELGPEEIVEPVELIVAAEQSMYELKRKIRGLVDEPAQLPDPPGTLSSEESKVANGPVAQPPIATPRV